MGRFFFRFARSRDMRYFFLACCRIRISNSSRSGDFRIRIVDHACFSTYIGIDFQHARLHLFKFWHFGLVMESNGGPALLVYDLFVRRSVNRHSQHRRLRGMKLCVLWGNSVIVRFREKCFDRSLYIALQLHREENRCFVAEFRYPAIIVWKNVFDPVKSCK